MPACIACFVLFAILIFAVTAFVIAAFVIAGFVIAALVTAFPFSSAARGPPPACPPKRPRAEALSESPLGRDVRRPWTGQSCGVCVCTPTNRSLDPLTLRSPGEGLPGDDRFTGESGWPMSFIARRALATVSACYVELGLKASADRWDIATPRLKRCSELSRVAWRLSTQTVRLERALY